MNLDKLKAQLIRHEGLRLQLYVDTVGKTTIGVGRNLTDCGINYLEAMVLLDHDIAVHRAELLKRAPWIEDLDEVRQRCLLDMAFNLGVPGLMKFTRTLARVKAGQYEDAALAMMQSRWAQQVKGRAKTLAAMMATGQDVSDTD